LIGSPCKQTGSGVIPEIQWSQCSWKHLNDGFLQTLHDRLERCGLLWCFYQLFELSFWRHPFTAEDPLHVMLNFFKSDPMKKKLYILDGLRVRTLSAHFWVNSFNLLNWQSLLISWPRRQILEAELSTSACSSSSRAPTNCESVCETRYTHQGNEYNSKHFQFHPVLLILYPFYIPVDFPLWKKYQRFLIQCFLQRCGSTFLSDARKMTRMIKQVEKSNIVTLKKVLDPCLLLKLLPSMVQWRTFNIHERFQFQKVIR